MSAAQGGLTLAELAAALGGTAEGDPETRIHGAAGLDDAAPGALVRVEDRRFLAPAEEGPAAAILAEESLGPVVKPCIRVPRVRVAFIRCLELFAQPERAVPGIHPAAVVDATAEIGEGCSIGPGAVVGPGARLAAGVVLHAHAVLMEDVEVGPETVIFPHAVLYPRTVVGARVRIHAGAVLGSDGYGYEWTGEKHLKRPHNGRVRIEDDVEIGANTTVDRATTGETVIGAGTKIDNLVQIGHNVTTGAHCLLVAQVGVAGTAALGNGVVLAGQVGVKDHVRIADGVVVLGQSGVWGDLDTRGIYTGGPARPRRESLKVQAAVNQLPDLIRRVQELEARLAEGE